MAVGLLIIAAEVLEHPRQPLVRHRLGLDLAADVAEDGVLGVVLEVTAGVGGAVNVPAGGVDLAEAHPVALLTEVVAPQPQHLFAEGGGAEHLRIEKGAALMAVRTVAAGIGREVHRGDGIHAHLVAGNLGQLGGAELIDELLPLGVVEGHVLHFDEGDAVILVVVIGGDIGGIRRLFVLEVLHQVLDLRRGGQRNHRVGEGIPVRAGHIGHRAGDEVVDIPVLKQIGDHHAGIGRDGIGGVVQTVQGVFARLCRITVHRIAFGVEHTGHAPGRQDVVQGVMSVVADGEVIVACVKDVTAGLGAVRAVDRILVVGGKDVIGKLQGHCLALTCGQVAGLGEVHQLDSALFGLSGLPGQLDIELDHILAHAAVSRRSVVRDLYLRRDGVRGLIPVHTQQLLGKVGIGYACTERKDHLVGIVPAAVLAGIDTLGAGGIVDPKHLILIAGLIVLIAHIDALGVHQVLVLIQAGQVVKGEVAGVLHGGGAERVGGVGDDVPAGGVGLAQKGPGHAGHAVVARIADPQAGIHAIVGQPAQVHGIAGVNHHDNLVEGTGIPDHVERVNLLLMEAQLGHANRALLPVALKAMVQVALFASETAHDIDGRIAVAAEGAFRSGIGTGRDLADQAGLGPVAAGSHDGVVNRLVDLGALLFQRVKEVNTGIGRTARAAVVYRSSRSVAEQSHAGAGGQGQGIVFVAQQHAALDLALDEIVLLVRAHLLHSGVIRLVISSVVGGLNGGRRGAQEEVDVTLAGEGQALAKHGQGKHQYHGGAETPPEIFLFHAKPSSSIPRINPGRGSQA